MAADSTRNDGGYKYQAAGHNESHRYLIPGVEQALLEQVQEGKPKRLFDLGCGNGAMASYFADRGYSIRGVDASIEGIALAKKHRPDLDVTVGDVCTDLAATYGQYPLVLSTEVVEHVYYPRRYAKTLYDLVEPGGLAIVSTPYHGYLKNLALALSGKLDSHFTALLDHGHIKFWSEKTLRQLLGEAGFRSVDFRRVGRIAPLAKSMIALARK